MLFYVHYLPRAPKTVLCARKIIIYEGLFSKKLNRLFFPLLNDGPKLLSPASDKAELLTELLCESSHLDGSGISLPAFF